MLQIVLVVDELDDWVQVVFQGWDGLVMFQMLIDVDVSGLFVFGVC